MTRFLARRSTALWVFLLGLLALVGAMKVRDLLASESVRPQTADKNLSARWPDFSPEVEPEEEPTTPADRPPWAQHLNLGRARLRKGNLEQVLGDGTRIVFSLDPSLQARATELFRQFAPPYGACVMLEVKTGRILALAGISRAEPKLDPLTLTLRAWAPAASVFKVVTTAALLMENRARPTTRACYHGGEHHLAIHHLVDDPERDDQCDTLAGALAKSINPIFGKLARKHLDRSTLLQYANAFGFNQPLDFVLPAAVSPANIPEEPLERARVASGFWHVNLSPLHGAMMAQAIANRGVMLRPRLVKEVRKGKDTKLPLPRGWSRRVTTEYVARLLGRMMVMTTTVGTAQPGFYDRSGRPYLPWARVAGKTGSLSRTEPFVEYNWFIGFAPARRPKVAFAVLLGNAARWRIKAYHMARFLLHEYLTRNLRQGPGTTPKRPRSRLQPKRTDRP